MQHWGSLSPSRTVSQETHEKRPTRGAVVVTWLKTNLSPRHMLALVQHMHSKSEQKGAGGPAS